MDEAALREAYLRKIIARYASHINFSEKKSIPELKALADPKRVDRLRMRLESENHLDYASLCFDFVSGLSNLHVPLAVSFWLDVDDALELSAGDPLDKALMLVALLNSKPLDAFVRVVLLENELQHALVWFSPEGSVHLLDPVHRIRIKDSTLDFAMGQYGQTHQVRKSLY